MKIAHMKLAARMVAVFFLSTVPLQSADLVKYSAQPRGNTVKIEGTSTLHDWAMEGHLVGGSFLVDPSINFDPKQEKIAAGPNGSVPAEVNAVIPVRSLKSAHTTMDEIMQEAMNEKQHPRITYKLKGLKLSEAARQPNAPFQFKSTGDLTVNGVTKEVSFPVTIIPAGESKLKITGKTPLKMSDFKVTAPRPKLALGLIRTSDDITVSFEWIVSKGS